MYMYLLSHCSGTIKIWCLFNSCQTWYMKIIFAFVSDFATAVKPAKKLGEEKTNSSIEAVEGLAVSIS